MKNSVVIKGSCGENLKWMLDNGKLTIWGTGQMPNWYRLWQRESLPPWREQKDSIVSVVIKDGVENIGDEAFECCRKLISVIIPSSVTKIGNSAFASCAGLVNVVIPSSVTEIGEAVFLECCSMTNVVISDSVTEIRDFAFLSCRSLASINIPDSVTKIGEYAFSGCDRLTSIAIPANVSRIDKYAFSNCVNLKSIIIPNSVIETGEKLFWDSYSLTDVYYDGSEEEWNRIKAHIGNRKEYLQDDVTFHVGEFIVGGFFSSNLAWWLDRDGILTISGKGKMRNWNREKKKSAPWHNYKNNITSIIINDGVKSIGNEAFDGCGKMTSIVIPNSVKSIGRSALSGCGSLARLDIPLKVSYSGTEDEWNRIHIGNGNEALLNVGKLFGERHMIPEGWCNSDLERVEAAYKYAARVRRQKYRKGTTISCLEHLVETAHIALSLDDNSEIFAAALLHDVIEDSSYTFNDIENAFGSNVKWLIVASTEEKMRDVPLKDSWFVRKRWFLDRLPYAEREEKIVILSDKLSDMRELAKDYEKIGTQVWKRFNQKDARAHEWYYRSIGDAMCEFAETDAWQEYEKLISVVFGNQMDADTQIWCDNSVAEALQKFKQTKGFTDDNEDSDMPFV